MKTSSVVQFFKFALAGGLSAASNFVLYYVFLVWLHWWYIAASILAFTLSIVVGFYLQKMVTFRDDSREGTARQMFMFFLISFGNLFINIVLLAFFVEVLSIDKLLAKVMSIGILACWNFFVYKYVVFNKKTPQRTAEQKS